ncbi:uncharacterized protein si:ch1073-126c3.2 [Anabas testudineus]|uniref:Uncharacterized protein n=1 Tax=Anabas testudineus TaxID=64144 RepID=A0A3Q1ISY1_ANATE|nr:uncharacterized protein si:ch1073-126c3.2 [Anabas testudineus]
MAFKGALIWLCSLAVLSSSTAQHETVSDNCSAKTQLLDDLKVAVECGESLLSAWSTQQRAALLLSMKNLTDSLHKHQLKECHGAEPKQCPEAEVPDNGGLVCVTVANKRYCKPMCNNGYDFAFLRISRLYEECSVQTQYKWTTQYIGGNKLAVCNEESTQVSGAKSAYFPKGQDCQTTKSNSQLQENITATFITELKNQGIQGQPQFTCLVCGRS